MVCYHPLTAFYGKSKGDTGKRPITFSRGGSFSGVPLKLPCGQCVGCRLEKSRQWAMRCMHEKQLHADSCFLTLTYDDKEVPKGGTLVKRDLQLFNKRLRKACGSFRFYACGEYGERYGRPHYHSCVFGLDFADKRFYKYNAAGQPLWTSKRLEAIWDKGLCVVGGVDFDSAAYVARYIMAKVTGDLAGAHYGDRLPEFTVMSRRPGIGYEWFKRYGDHAYKHDSVIMNGKEVRPPRFYDTKFELAELGRMALIKRKRRDKALKALPENKPDRRRVREKVSTARVGLYARDVK